MLTNPVPSYPSVIALTNPNLLLGLSPIKLTNPGLLYSLPQQQKRSNKSRVVTVEVTMVPNFGRAWKEIRIRVNTSSHWLWGSWRPTLCQVKYKLHFRISGDIYVKPASMWVPGNQLILNKDSYDQWNNGKYHNQVHPTKPAREVDQFTSIMY